MTFWILDKTGESLIYVSLDAVNYTDGIVFF